MTNKLEQPLPHGLPAIMAAYGNPWDYVDRKPAWEGKCLVTIPLPKSLPYAYGPVRVQSIRAHFVVAQVLADTLMACLAAGVPDSRLAYGGCYAWRPKRTATQLSVHTWGLAIDIDPAHNPQGKTWDGGSLMQHPLVVNTFREAGFVWGGSWSNPDCMHFQAVEGY